MRENRPRFKRKTKNPDNKAKKIIKRQQMPSAGENDGNPQSIVKDEDYSVQ